MNAAEISEKIRKGIPDLKQGTLRFWGYWFGKPYDNVHSVIDCGLEGNLLRLKFNEGESLTIADPASLKITAGIFQIGFASHVRWEWFYYGRSQTSENQYFYDFKKNGNEIVATSNVDWYKPEFKMDSKLPAVEIL